MGNGNQKLPKTIIHSSKTPATISTIFEHNIAIAGEFYVTEIKILNQIQPIFGSYYDPTSAREDDAILRTYPAVEKHFANKR